jgi:hypothetical protein
VTGSLVMQGASGECGIDAGESMIVVLLVLVKVGLCKTGRDRLI